MDTVNQVIATAEEPKKKRTWLKIILNFLLFGGWILVVGVGIATAIVLDMYVF